MKEEPTEKKENFLQRHKMSVFVAVSAVVMLIGLSYAWLQLTLRGTKDLTLTAGTLSLVLDDSMEGGVSMDSVVPVTDDEGKSQEGYTFTLENNGSIDSNYTIYLDDLALDEGQTKMNDEFIKFSLTKEGQEETLLLSQTVVDGKKVLDLGNIGAGSKYTYNLKMWISADATNEVMGTAFKGQLRIEAVQDVERTKNFPIQPNDASVTYDTANEAQKKEMFAFTHNPGRGQVGYSQDELTDYRYVGENPNNYVTFNGETWRIIGIFTVENETGKKEQRIKLIRNESIGAYNWDNVGMGTSDWNASPLKQVLNAGPYYNRTAGECPYGINGGTIPCDYTTTGLTDQAKSMIGKTKWYLGGSNTEAASASKFYEAERGSNVYSGHSSSWIGDVGLVYPSDYGYASGESSCISTNLFNYESSCKNTDWLFNSTHQWTMTSHSSYSNYIFAIHSTGRINEGSSVTNSLNVRPSVYLKSDVKLTSGNGTEADPYILEILS